jgi:transcriptional regulator with XRE-family HTH domain
MHSVNTVQQGTTSDNCRTSVDAHRTPWAALDGNQGGVLIGWLFREANARGQHLSEMARELGVTYGYIHQLRTGVRKVEGISPCVTQAVARYLQVPAVLVMVAVGRIRTEDFVVPTVSRAACLKQGLRQVEADPLFGCVMPQSLWTASDELKQFVLALYADATQTELFPQRGLPMMLQDLQRAALAFEDDQVKVANVIAAQ